MSATVKLSSKLPGDPEINGLDAFSDYHDPETPICVIAWVVPAKITEDLATGARVPTMEIRRIEPIGTPAKVPQVIQDLAAELYEKRTNRNPLPFSALMAPKGDVDEMRVGDAVGELREAGVILAKPVSPDAQVFVFEAPEYEDDGDE